MLQCLVSGLFIDPYFIFNLIIFDILVKYLIWHGIIILLYSETFLFVMHHVFFQWAQHMLKLFLLLLSKVWKTTLYTPLLHCSTCVHTVSRYSDVYHNYQSSFREDQWTMKINNMMQWTNSWSHHKYLGCCLKFLEQYSASRFCGRQADQMQVNFWSLLYIKTFTSLLCCITALQVVFSGKI